MKHRAQVFDHTNSEAYIMAIHYEKLTTGESFIYNKVGRSGMLELSKAAKIGIAAGLFVVVATAIVVPTALLVPPQLAVRQEWKQYKAEFNKDYNSTEEENIR